MDMKYKVGVIGLGPMGRAIAKTLLDAGCHVTVWNRTQERGLPLIRQGARLADTPQDAISSSDLVFVSLTDYDAMWQVFTDAETALAGRTIINLSSGTPQATRTAAERMASLDAVLLAGSPMSIAPDIGTSESSIYYGGDATVFETYHEVFAILGAARYLGEDHGRVQLLVQAKYGLLYTVVTGFAQALALARSGGFSAQSFLPEAVSFLEKVPGMMAPDGIDALATRIDSGDYVDVDGDNAMLAASLEHLVSTSEEARVDSHLARTLLSFYRRAVDEGFSREGWTRLIEMMARAELVEGA